MPAKPSEIADAMEQGDNQGMRSFLERSTGEVHLLFDKYSGGENDPKFEAQFHKNPSAFIEIPGISSRDAFVIMEVFASDISNERQRERVEDALAGKGAFRRFKDMVSRLGISDAWFAFHRAAMLSRARKWLEREGIAFHE